MNAIQSYAKTTQETSAQRIAELAHAIGYMGGVAADGARALAMLIATLEVRVTELESRLAVAEYASGKITTADPPRTRR